MAGLFDFKSAEEILKERQDATRKNVMEAFNQPGQYKVRGERTANAVGKALGLLGGRLFAGSPEEQVAGQMQRANQLAQSLKPIEGESQSQFYNRIAASFNDAGYSQNALKALTLAKEAEAADAKEAQRQLERKQDREQLTGYQKIMSGISQQNADTAAAQAAFFNLGGGDGAPAGGSEKPSVPTEEGKRFFIGEVEYVVRNGAPVKVEDVKALDEAGLTAGTGVFGNIWNAVTTPFNLLADASQEVENQRLIASVKNAFDTGAFSPEAKRAAKQVLELPRELTGLTDKQYDLLGKLDGLKTGGQ